MEQSRRFTHAIYVCQRTNGRFLSKSSVYCRSVWINAMRSCRTLMQSRYPLLCYLVTSYRAVSKTSSMCALHRTTQMFVQGGEHTLLWIDNSVYGYTAFMPSHTLYIYYMPHLGAPFTNSIVCYPKRSNWVWQYVRTCVGLYVGEPGA